MVLVEKFVEGRACKQYCWTFSTFYKLGQFVSVADIPAFKVCNGSLIHFPKGSYSRQVCVAMHQGIASITVGFFSRRQPSIVARTAKNQQPHRL